MSVVDLPSVTDVLQHPVVINYYYNTKQQLVPIFSWHWVPTLWPPFTTPVPFGSYDLNSLCNVVIKCSGSGSDSYWVGPEGSGSWGDPPFTGQGRCAKCPGHSCKWTTFDSSKVCLLNHGSNMFPIYSN